MKRLIPTLLYGALATAFGAQAATPPDTLVVVSSLEGIISLDPAESFETVSSANLVNLYQRLVAPDRGAAKVGAGRRRPLASGRRWAQPDLYPEAAATFRFRQSAASRGRDLLTGACGEAEQGAVLYSR